jgi:hypothetical protein
MIWLRMNGIQPIMAPPPLKDGKVKLDTLDSFCVVGHEIKAGSTRKKKRDY